MTMLEAAPGSTALPAQRKGEKRPDTAHAKASAEVNPAGALAHSSASAEPIAPPSQEGLGPDAASSTDKELTRASCKLQLDLSDLCSSEEARVLHRKRSCPGAEGGCPACAAARTLRAVRRECNRIANMAQRLRWAADADLVDRYYIAEGRAPKGKEWEAIDYTQAIERVTSGMRPAERAVLLDKCRHTTSGGKTVLYPYPLLRHVAPTISAGIVSMIDNQVMQKWNETRWPSLVQMEKNIPQYNWDNPIPLRKADVKLQHVDGKRFLLSFSVSRRTDSVRGKEFSFPIYGRDDYQMSLLTLLASDSARMGALQLDEDRKRPGRWYVRIAYRKLADKCTGVKAAAINKGMVCFLAGVTDDGARTMDDGAAIEAYLKQVQSRRQRYQRQVKWSGRIGHGRTRTLRPIEHLQGQGEAWRDTRCQTIARRFVNWLVTQKVGRLYIDDFSGIRDTLPEGLLKGEWIWNRIQEWPFYKLQMKIISCCEERGIEAIVRNPKHISGTCPKCRSRDVKFIKRRLHCSACRHVVHWDYAAAQVNLQDGEAERRGEKEVESKPGKKKTTKKKQ